MLCSVVARLLSCILSVSLRGSRLLTQGLHVLEVVSDMIRYKVSIQTLIELTELITSDLVRCLIELHPALTFLFTRFYGSFCDSFAA
jgi:hypothetical protein